MDNRNTLPHVYGNASNRDVSPSSSGPGSVDSMKSAGRIIIGIAPSPAKDDNGNVLRGSEGGASFSEGGLADGSILRMLLTSDMQEMLFELPPKEQKEILVKTTHELMTRGTGEAIQSICQSMHIASKTQPVEPNEWHGLLGNGACWSPPRVVAQSGEVARPGYDTGNATEYLDSKEVLREKAKLLAQMWKRSGRDTVLYTGAGLSTASGIGDYASKASGSVAPHKKKSSLGSRLDLQPTLAHHALAAIEEKGLIGNWVQQNHDRLAQKAGVPQARINEIHGAWGDMKNSVKMMDDRLRDDLMAWLRAWAERADMCVALGTSLCGMNADQVPEAVAERFARSSGEGLVIIGLQRTAYDDVASLRIWGLCDDVMTLVAKEIGCKIPNTRAMQRGARWVSSHPRCAYNTPTRTARDPL